MNAQTDLSDVDVVVLAGGLGTRIQPVLGDIPKLLAPIGDETYLDLLVRWLAGYGVRRLILSLGHRADAIEGYLSAHDLPIEHIETVVEDEPLGTAGALRMVRPFIKSDIALVMNGDSWTGADLGLLVAHQRSRNTSATLLCVEVENAGRYGQVSVDDQGGIQNFNEKSSTDAGSGLISAGIYAISSAGWRMIEDASGPSLERDVFQSAAPGSLAAYDAADAPFIDIGTPDSLQTAAAYIDAHR